MSLSAQKLCSDSKLDFSEVFRGQYCLSKDKYLEIPDFLSREFGEWVLFTCPTLNVTEILTNSGKAVGLLVGTGISAEGEYLQSQYKLPVSGKKVVPHIEEDFLLGLAGKYVLIIDWQGEERVYGDAAISMPCVYNAETHSVASSLFLTTYDELVETPYFNGDKIYHGTGKFGFGITADQAVLRHRANHRLDLNTFELTRFWPTDDTSFNQLDPSELMPKIQAKLRQNIDAIVQNMECMFAVSGGRDSRVLLGYVKSHLDKIGPFHTVKHNWMSGFDVQGGKRLAEVVGFDHVVFDVQDEGQSFPTRDRVAYRQLRRKTWYSRGMVCDVSLRMDYALEFMVPHGKTLLRGNMLELLNAQWTPPEVYESGSPECFEHIIKWCAFNDEPTVAQTKWRKRQLKKWYDSLLPSMKERVYDFAYTELFLSNNQCALLLNTLYYIAPFCDRQIFQWTMQLPLEFRLEATAHNWLIRNSDVPDLAEVPLARQLLEEHRNQKRA